jgi:GntR family transcriptional regulator
MSPVKAARLDDEAEAPFALPEVDRGEPMPLHEQVAASIRRAIAEGEANAGERVPQAKDLAAVLGVNTNTVLRALHLLRDEGLLEMGRGKAIRVTGDAEQGAVVVKAKELITLARRNGYRSEELVDLMQTLLKERWVSAR